MSEPTEGVEELHLDLAACFDLLASLLGGHPVIEALEARGEHERAIAWRAKIIDVLVGADR